MKRKFILFTLILSFLTFTSAGVFAQDTAKVLDKETPVYRLYNVRTGEHLYTADGNEYGTLSGAPDWNGEGIAWYAPDFGNPVFRLYNKVTGFHLYTADDNEMSVLLYPCDRPWIPDNMTEGNHIHAVFYSGGSRPIYRLYNPGMRAHLLTADEGEYNTLAHNGWNAEGVVLTAVR